MMVESRWTRVGFLSVHARVSADPVPRAAPVVVLVHGLGVSSRYMIPLAEQLASFCQVYAPDLPGFGKSDKPPNVLNLAELADALAAWMDAAGLLRATLVGNSFGCQVIAELAVRHPERLEKVVLNGPTVDPEGRSALVQLWRWGRNSRYEPRSIGLVVVRDYLDCGLRRLFRTFRYAVQDRIEDKLPYIRVPALIVRGARDVIVPQRWAEEATRLLPMGRLIVVSGAAHTVNFGNPVEFAEAVRSFLCGDQAGKAAGPAA